VESLTLYPVTGFEILFGPIPWVLQTALSAKGESKGIASTKFNMTQILKKNQNTRITP
jgi:hypothetical protein